MPQPHASLSTHVAQTSSSQTNAETDFVCAQKSLQQHTGAIMLTDAEQPCLQAIKPNSCSTSVTVRTAPDCDSACATSTTTESSRSPPYAAGIADLRTRMTARKQSNMAPSKAASALAVRGPLVHQRARSCASPTTSALLAERKDSLRIVVDRLVPATVSAVAPPSPAVDASSYEAWFSVLTDFRKVKQEELSAFRATGGSGHHLDVPAQAGRGDNQSHSQSNGSSGNTPSPRSTYSDSTQALSDGAITSLRSQYECT